MPPNEPVLDDRQLRDLLEELARRLPAHSPEWTDRNASDPGVTLLELFAFLTEDLRYAANTMGERGRAAALELAGAARTLAAAGAGDCGRGPSVSTTSPVSCWGRGSHGRTGSTCARKTRRHNRHLHGSADR